MGRSTELLIFTVLAAGIIFQQPFKSPPRLFSFDHWIFETRDLNHDGVLDNTEIAAGLIEHIEGQLSKGGRADQTPDGALTHQELADFRRALTKAIAEGDNQDVLRDSNDDLAGLMIKSLDADNNGLLDSAELPPSVISQIEALDQNSTNDDGILDAAELESYGLQLFLWDLLDLSNLRLPVRFQPKTLS